VRKSVIAGIAVVLLVGGAVAAVPLVEQYAAAQIKTDMERDGATKVGAVEVGLLDRRIVFTDLRVKRFGEIAVGRWEASGLSWPLGELMRGRTPFSLRLGDPIHAGHVELRDVTIADDKGRWTIASLAIDDLHLDRYDPLLQPNQLTHVGGRIASALSLGHLEQKDTVFTDQASGDRVTMGGITIDRFDRGQVGSIKMVGFDITPKPPHDAVFRMGDVKLTDLDLRRAIRIVSAPTWRLGMPIGRVHVGSGSLTGFGGEMFSRYGMALGSITSQSNSENKDVQRSRLRIDGFVLDPPASTRDALWLRIGLQAMGLKELKLESDCAGVEDRAKGEVSVERCALSGPDLGDVSLSIRLVQADEPFWQAIDDHDANALLRTKAGLSNAKLVVGDRGLVERSLKAVATTSGKSVADVRAEFAQEVRRFQPPGVLITEDLTKLLDTIARFVERGGTLTLEAKPDAPLGLDKVQYFTRPGPDLVNVLGLSATLSR
jgi:hypothetical protein